jgi:uncharacterized CHY-type Zn-finger protein
MSDRREFPRAVRIAIVKRACRNRDDGRLNCERCGAIGIPFEIHHRIMDAMEIDKTRKLTAEDGELICGPCHNPITAKQRRELAKAQRRQEAHLGASRDADRPLQSRGFEQAQKKKKPSLEVAAGLPEIARRYR